MRSTPGAGLAAIVFLMSCSSPASSPAEENKDLVQRFTQAVNEADWDALADLTTEDFTRHSAATIGPPVRSREEFVALQQGFLTTFPDQNVTLEDLVAEGDRVAIRATYRGTMTGPMGELQATGNSTESPFIAVLRVDSGRIAELWVEWDNMAMMQQLGLFPPPPPDETE